MAQKEKSGRCQPPAYGSRGKTQAQPVLCSWRVSTLPYLAMPSNHVPL
ncbi:MAG: hypothetical protein IJF01_06175 [Tidjanibacter sp.]|nr:hypothetical protein [Tidjanibacter sp.]